MRSFIRKLQETTLPPSALLGLLILVILLAGVGASAATLDGSSREHARQIAEDAVRRAAVTCYAVEGCYPATYEYLCENYPVGVDPEKFLVYYDVFASNIMPSISVIAVQGE